ncbi:MAG: hypothetical protein AAFY72_14240, partial [Cyanobacteria bacterium J06649_4]
MMITLRSRFLIVAIAIASLCQSCHSPSSEVSAASNADTNNSTVSLTPAPAPIPGAVPDADSTDTNTEGLEGENTAPAQQCDLSTQLS